jgi:predicted ABC-type ATPase
MTDYRRWFPQPGETQQNKQRIIRHNDLVRQYYDMAAEEVFSDDNDEPVPTARGQFVNLSYGRASPRLGGAMERIEQDSMSGGDRADEHPARMRLERAIEALEEQIQGERQDILDKAALAKRISPVKR